MTKVKPAAYWRNNKNWKDWVGKKGTVVASTYIKVAASSHELSAPYSYLLVDFGQEKKELVGVGHSRINSGDRVECVLRKNPSRHESGLIEYVLKAEKL